MTKGQVKEVLDRVLTGPPERQADVVHMVELMEEQDRSDLRLSDEDVAKYAAAWQKRTPRQSR